LGPRRAPESLAKTTNARAVVGWLDGLRSLSPRASSDHADTTPSLHPPPTKNNRQGSNPLKMGVPKRVPSLNSQVEAKVRELGGDKAIHR